MYGERAGWGGYGRPRIVNDAMKADEQAEIMADNVLRPREDD